MKTTENEDFSRNSLFSSGSNGNWSWSIHVIFIGGEPLVVVVVQTDTPSKSLVPTSIPSVSLRPSVHPSLPPTTVSLLSIDNMSILNVSVLLLSLMNICIPL